MARTTKPCPGCGAVDRYRPADKVCTTCAKTLADVAKIRAEAEQLRATVAASLVAETKPRNLYVPEKGYGILHGNRMSDSDEYFDLRDKTVAMFLALLAPLDRRRVDQWLSNGSLPGSGEYARHDRQGCVEATDAGVEAAKVWWKSLTAFSQACYGAGVEDGRDLLGQLAAGLMTADQVTDRAFELVTRKRRY
jgi:hypothetical protein